jgi:transposase
MESNPPTNESVNAAGSTGAAGGGKRQVKRSAAERRRIVEETLGPGVSVAEVARRHGLNANQIFTWRRLYRTGKLGRGQAVEGFIPVEVIGECSPSLPAPPNQVSSARSKAGAAQAACSWPVEVEVQNGVKVRLSAGVDAEFMRRVLHLARDLS